MAAIFGGSGMLGRALQQAIIEKNPNVKDIKLFDIRDHPLNNKAFEFVQVDVVNESVQSIADKLHGIHVLYWVITPPYQTATKKMMQDVNVKGITNVLDAFKSSATSSDDPKSFVYTSSVGAVGNFYTADNMSEKDPIPSIKTFVSEYDITKRLGEEIILARNDPDNGFFTCALRPNAIQGDETDFFRTFFEKKKTSYMKTPAFDIIVARDLGRALVKAGERVSVVPELQGKAVFITKSKYDEDIGAVASVLYIASKMGFKVTTVPSVLIPVIVQGMKAHYVIQHMFGCGKDLATAPYQFLQLISYKRTFDNSLGKQLLDWEPEESWQSACDKAMENWIAAHPQDKPKAK